MKTTKVILSKPRENAIIVYMRFRQGLSINHISQILTRSTRSIWATCKVAEERLGRLIDNRTKPPHIRNLRAAQFRRKLVEYKIRAKLFLDHWVEDLKDAFNIQSVPLHLLRMLLGKNSEVVNEADQPP